MSQYPARNVEYSSVSDIARNAAVRFEEEILSYGKGAAIVSTALDADPDWALGYAYNAAMHLFRINRQGQCDAVNLLAKARHCRPGSPTEALIVAAVTRWANENFEAAGALLEEALAHAPHHLFASKLAQHLYFSRGHVRPMLRCAKAAAAACPTDGRSFGMLAFALDQNGAAAGAEQAARHALDLGADPWAHHAMAHVLDAGGRYAEGRRWMDRHQAAWAECSSFLFTHNAWHGALFHLALDDYDSALAIYHDAVWARRKNHGQDQINAISLLARLELYGIDVGDRWQDIASHVVPASGDAYDGFLDLHFAYALARADELAALDRLLDRLDEAASRDSALWRQPLPTAARALADFARGDVTSARRKLAMVDELLPLLGGSSVQRQLFSMISAAADVRPKAQHQMAFA